MTEQHTARPTVQSFASKLARLTMPFLAIGIAFIALGLLLDDDMQFSFGIVWLVIAGIAMFVRARSNRQIHARQPEHHP